jgi:hypothetical protein
LFCDLAFIHLRSEQNLYRALHATLCKARALFRIASLCVNRGPLAHLAAAVAAARLALISTFDMLLIMAHGEEKKMSCARPKKGISGG